MRPLGQVRARGFGPDGTETQPEFIANPRGGGEQLRPRLAVDRLGRRYVVWEDDEDRNGFFQIHAQVRTPTAMPSWTPSP
jgi:hypothetical protein